MSSNNSTSLYSIFACVSLTCAYVASLYVWRVKLHRDHPDSIKRRFFSVICMMFVAPFITHLFLDKRPYGDEYYKLYGIRWTGLIPACILPLVLTVVLFLGPLTLQYYSGIWKLYSQPVYWVSSCRDLIWLRNHVMAPLSEEWVFRSCMMPLLLQCLPPVSAIIIGPLLFGVAHFHHVFEQMKAGCTLTTAVMISTFQFVYTSIFGIYSSMLFVRTGHFVAPLLAHIFCNHMGFPNVSEIFHYETKRKAVIIINFAIGLFSWGLLLMPLTSPEYYDNKFPWPVVA